MPNTNLAARILDRITADPDAFEAGLLGFATTNSHAVWPDDDIDGNDTQMGIAGWACHLSGWKLSTDDIGTAWAFVEDWEQRRNPVEVAAELLGLDGSEMLEEEDRDGAITGLRRIAEPPLALREIRERADRAAATVRRILDPKNPEWQAAQEELTRMLALAKEHDPAYPAGDELPEEATYSVVWETDIFAATSPEHAVRKALAIHRNPKSVATIFQVTGPDGVTHRIDLSEIDGNL